MYPGTAASLAPDRPAIGTAEDGETCSHARLDERSARFATVPCSRSIVAGDSVLVLLHRDDLRTHRVAVHAGAPCPPEVKRALLRERHGRAAAGTRA